jgi:hypothetical protein
MCEGAILLFSLHELLVGIDTRTGLLVPGFSRLSIFPWTTDINPAMLSPTNFNREVDHAWNVW